MADRIEYVLQWLLGPSAIPSLHEMMQMSLRALVLFVIALALVRMAHKRFLGRFTPFDFILAFIIGSTLSRAINGRAPFFETIAASSILIALHYIISALAYRYHMMSRLFKGKPETLIEKGLLNRSAMDHCSISRGDLEEVLRIHGKIPDLRCVELATLERNGDISVIAKQGCGETGSAEKTA